ncbi:type VI secretion system lipoprotein TssJ [Marinomonas primoryensis]|uniref:T6SS secretion lipoprotein TssJ (VasD) n=1 Tax=Marinomonas primoryensis TaxID=178399 RepID=A0A859CU13_9GAMM|nr:type VI secretion system lipoprotein TssJ [Marinomonas primoryensis]QKK79835.1 T6SS secretion lipoprotein TssJ (VasD) [Marinomonas primoryensis]
MLNKNVITPLLYFLCAQLITGCSSLSDTTITPGEAKDELTQVTFSLVADDDVNPGLFGVASPIEIQVFELVDDSMFMSADFDQITEDYEKALKNNFIKSYDYVMTPGQFKFIDDFEINTETNYIGVMAKFSEPDLSEWKKAVKILNRGRIYHLLMFFNDYEVKLKKVE